MDGAGRRDARRRTEAVQRIAQGAGEHFATHVDVDAARARARRASHAHGDAEHSAACGLRVDPAWPLAARAGERAQHLGAQEPRRDRHGKGAV